MDTRSDNDIHPMRRGAAIVAMGAITCAVIGACSDPAPNRLGVSDWCWLHYRLAPPGALAADPGPESIGEARSWATWLGSSSDAPVDRQDAHRTQRRSIDDFLEDGSWTNTARDSYRVSAQAEPTPDTICETAGARIVVADDGSLPTGWDERFLDPDDPAFSDLAATGDLGRQNLSPAGLDR